MFLKKILMFFLRRDRVKISYQELSEVMDIYTNLMKYLLEENFDYKEIYSFLKKGFVSHYDLTDDYCYKTFLELIKLKRDNLLMYLDYALLTSNVEVGYGRNLRGIICYIYVFLEKIVSIYKEYPRTYKGEIRSYTYRIFDDETDKIVAKLGRTNGVSSSYKDIISAYNEAYKIYYPKSKGLYAKYGIKFDNFLEETYYFFLENGLLYKEPECVLEFVKSFAGNEEEILDKMLLGGFNKIDYVDDKIISYIAMMYQKSKEERIIIR